MNVELQVGGVWFDSQHGQEGGGEGGGEEDVGTCTITTEVFDVCQQVGLCGWVGMRWCGLGVCGEGGSVWVGGFGGGGGVWVEG